MPNTNKDNPFAEGTLAKYREVIDNIFQDAGLSYWFYDTETGLFDVSSSVLLQNHYNPAEFTNTTIERWKTYVHPDDVDKAVGTFVQLAERQIDVMDCDYRMRNADGQYIYFRIIGSVSMYNLNGKPLRLAGTMQNINDAKEAEIRLRRRDGLLEAVASCANILVNARTINYGQSIHNVLQVLGSAAGVDRVYIWKNYNDAKTGRLRASQIYEWSPGAEPMQGNVIVQDVDFDEVAPSWRGTLTAGKCVNNIVRLMTKAEQDHLLPQNIISILVAPIIFQDKFWGFIGFDNCRSERIWDESESGILRSVGSMIASTINRHETELVLAEEQQLLDRIIETAPVNIIQSRNGIIERINRKAAEIFHCAPGQPATDIYGSKELRDKVWSIIQKDGIYYNNDFILTPSGGTERRFIAVIFTIGTADSGGTGERAIGWFVDVTDMRKTEANLIKAKNDADIATRAKSDFLARMSHEIRTPMNAVLGLIYLCLQTELTDKQRDYLVKTQTAANNLLGIINDILDFSKIEAGKIELERIAFRLSDVLSELRDVIEFTAKEKGLKLEITVSPGVVDNLIGDPLRLRQILLNLLSNAVKFTLDGSVIVTVKDIPQDEEKHQDLYKLEFLVTDTGIGLTEEQMKHIFDSFAQADTSTVRKYGGTGLGLSIVKRLVELMDGQISVESEAGKGATFRFTAYFIRTAAQTDESSAVLLYRRRVLVVDDENDTREVIVELVKTLNLQADAAASGSEALEKLALATRYGNPYELVLMDWRMPRMDGIETIRQIHKQDSIITPPHIVMISAYDRQDCVQQTQGLNVAGVLVKPVKINDLKQLLKTAFRILKQQNVAPVQEIKTDIKGAKVLLAEDNKINQLVASELLKTYGIEFTIANNGREAVEAVKAKDFDLILMDVQMPEMDGLTATQTIRQLSKPGIARLPILAMTANALDTDYQKSLDVGMNDHLTKPIDPAKLRLALEKWIKR
ncbi:MAG: response regulator [Planctomycetaceae bacterium]|jgi:signal transduction histidine kinase/CheY-like chemotaxis protein|nr:response regulator [Planctomycetaceae bacterium]